MLWHNYFKCTRGDAYRCRKMTIRAIPFWIAIDLNSDWFACMDLDGCPCFVAYPVFTFFPTEQKDNANDDTPKHALLTHNADIKQSIIAFGLPCIFDCARIKLSIADNNLDSICSGSVVVHLEDS